MNIQPYLFFEGRCDEAITFYQSALGAELVMRMRFGESPDPSSCPGVNPESVMHAEIKVRGSSIMMSDGMSDQGPTFTGFALSLAVPSAAEVDATFAKLAETGQVTMAPAQTFWTERFAMVVDRFGVHWMLTVQPK